MRVVRCRCYPTGTVLAQIPDAEYQARLDARRVRMRATNHREPMPARERVMTCPACKGSAFIVVWPVRAGMPRWGNGPLPLC